MKSTEPNHLINMQEVHDYLSKFFTTQEEFEEFADKASQDEATRKGTLITVWLTRIARKLREVEPDHVSLSISFLVFMAESASSTLYPHVTNPFERFKKFFSNISEKDKAILENSFSEDMRAFVYMPLEKVVSFFYEIRCKLVHEGIFFDLFLNDSSDPNTSTLSFFKRKGGEVTVEVKIDYENLEAVFLRTSLENIKKLI